MRIILFIVSALFFFVCGAWAHSHVVVGTEDNFDVVAYNSKASLVKFYAPWCGHCKKLAPAYDSAAEKLAHDLDDGLVSLIKVDCTVEKDLCDKYSIRGFPTLKVFRGDNQESVTDYKGARTEQGIIDFMLQQIKPATTNLGSEKEVNDFHKDGKVSIVAYFMHDEDQAKGAFVDVAEKLRGDYDFGYVLNQSPKERKITITTADGETSELWLGADFSSDLFTSWIQQESFSLIGEIGPENYESYMKRGLPIMWVFTDKSDKEATQAVIDACMPTAKKLKGNVSVVKLDGVRWAEHGQNFGLKSTTPGIVLQETSGAGKKFIFSGDCTNAEELSAFSNDWTLGKLEPHMKTEPVPENNDGDVMVVVGSTFNDIVLSSKHNVLVEFYAPWCGHCKNLAPKYEEVGAYFKDREDVIIAKIDSTANDTPADVKGFPTLIFYPAGEGNPIKYDKARNAEDMQTWIEEHAVAVEQDVQPQGHDEL